MKNSVGWVTALVVAVLWAAFAVGVWAADGAIAFKIGAPVLAVGFAAVAALAYRRRGPSADSADGG